MEEGRALDERDSSASSWSDDAYPARDRVCPEGVLEPGVVRPWIHQVSKAQLVHAVQPLQFRGVQEGQDDPLDPDAAVDGVLDDLVSRSTCPEDDLAGYNR